MASDLSHCPAAGARPQAHVPTLNLHQAFDNREAEARAATLGREEGLEDLIADVVGDARAAIAHFDPAGATIDDGLDLDGLAARRLAGIEDQVEHHGAQHLGIRLHHRVLATDDDLREVSGARARGGFRDDCPQRDRTPARWLRAREEQDILDVFPRPSMRWIIGAMISRSRIPGGRRDSRIWSDPRRPASGLRTSCATTAAS